MTSAWSSSSCFDGPRVRAAPSPLRETLSNSHIITVEYACRCLSIHAYFTAAHHDVTAIARPGSNRLEQMRRDGGLGLTKMAESCPGTTYARLSWLQAWHVRDETYSLALAELVNAQFRQPFAENWGDGTTSSSEGQRFKASSKAESTGHVNPKYGADPGRLFYTHVSDQYAPFSARVVNVGVRDSAYVLDGLLYHESDLRI